MALMSGRSGLLGRQASANGGGVPRTSPHARALAVARRSQQQLHSKALISQQQRHLARTAAQSTTTSRGGPSAIPDLLPLDAGEAAGRTCCCVSNMCIFILT